MEKLVRRLQEIREQVGELKADNLGMKQALLQKDKELNRLRQLIEIQNNSLKQLEQKLKIKRIADGLSGSDSEGSDPRALKFKVNEMIREVDRIISLLHQ